MIEFLRELWHNDWYTIVGVLVWLVITLGMVFCYVSSDRSCPQCHSNNIEMESFTGLCNGYAFTLIDYSCNDCGYTY